MKTKYLFIGNSKSPLAVYRFGMISALVQGTCVFYDRSAMRFAHSVEANRSNRLSLVRKALLYSRLDHIYSFFQVYLYILFNGVEVVVFHGVSRQFLCLLPWVANIRSIAIPQGSDINQAYQGFHKYFTSALLCASSVICVKSKNMRRRVLEICSNRQVQLLNWGVSPVFEENIDQGHLVLSSIKFTVISLRSFKPNYNIGVIFETISRLKEEGLPVHFIFVSLSDPGAELSPCVDEQYFGIPSEELCRLLSRSDVTVSIPSHDGFSTSVMESLMRGTYPIISDIEAYVDEFEDPLLCAKIRKIDVQNLHGALREAFDKLSTLRHTRNYRVDFALKEYSTEIQRKRLQSILESM